MHYANVDIMRNQKVKISRMINNQLVTDEISLVSEGCFYYFNAQHLFVKLSPKERSYFDFMCEKMDYDQRILLDNKFRKRFIRHISNITSSNDAPSMDTLRTNEKHMVDLKLVISVKNQGALHYVNPKYVCNGSPSKRKKVIQKLAELALKGTIDLSTILDRPVDVMQPNNTTNNYT